MALREGASGKCPQKFSARKMRAGNEVKKRTKTPRSRFADKMKADYRRFESAAQNRIAAHGLQTFLNRRTKKVVPRCINSVAGADDNVIDQAFCAIAQFHVDFVSQDLRGSNTAIKCHGNLRQKRTLPTSARRPCRSIANRVPQATR